MIKRYFIVVLLLSLFPAGVSAQRRAAAKKIGKRNTIMWVQCMTDVFSYTGAERVAIPVWAVFIRTAVSVIRTPAVRWSSRSSMTMPIVFPMGLPWSAKGKKNDRRFGLIDRQGREVVPCIYADVAGFRQALPGYRRDGFRPPLWVCRYAGTGRNSIEIRLCPGFFRRNGSRSQRRMER